MSKLKRFKTRFIETLLQVSLDMAGHEQKLDRIARSLEKAEPDIKDQYSSFELNTSYLIKKVRMIHAFQISLLESIINEFKNLVIVDIGDSSGTHLKYINELYAKDKKIDCVGLNFDSKAIGKIKARGFKAIQARAEQLAEYKINADIFLCFEVMEHLTDPHGFLNILATKTNAQYVVITVPYVRHSRVGLDPIRDGYNGIIPAEGDYHVFEFSPEDWKLLAKHTGWFVEAEKVYLQYPKWNILYLTKSLWRRFDYEGFYGMILRKNNATTFKKSG